MSLSNYPSGFRGGAIIKNVPMFDTIDGNVFWVDSGTGGAGNPGSFNSPLATISGAVAKCTANNGDVIYCKSGHSEAITAAGGLAIATAGITIVGLGNAGDMSQITFTTADTADIDITAASTRFFNIRFTAAFADVVNGLDISGNNTQFYGCKFDESGSGLNWLTSVMDIADGTDGLVVQDCSFRGDDASNDACIVFAGTHENVVIDGNTFFYGTAQTAVVAFITSATQQINMRISNNYFHSETAIIAAGFVVLTGTTNNGWAYNNLLSSVDADATAANAVSAFDVTGLACKGNWFTSGEADTYAIETFLTAENLT